MRGGKGGGGGYDGRGALGHRNVVEAVGQRGDHWFDGGGTFLRPCHAAADLVGSADGATMIEAYVVGMASP
jgi:hypothetical protein